MLPRLTAKANNSWLDPRDFKSTAEFERAYNISWAHAQAYKEIVQEIQIDISKLESLEKKAKGERKTERIGL